ncbi:MAG: radical SAM family heme chaperone HemW [Caulobacteraceae bacterium]
MTAPIGLYVHWPYCARICPYCDFNVVRERGRSEEKAALAEAIVADLRGHAALLGRRTLSSIFFGGGTPSLMAPSLAAEIIQASRALWPSAEDLEITLEANPTDAETARFRAFAAAGVNRLSLGVQSLEDASLRFLGRNHDAAAARRAARVAREVFMRVSIDLIYALPGQSLAAWRAELAEAIALGVEHISPYQLTIEPKTAFDRARSRGRLAIPNAEHAAALFEATQEILSRAGFEAYEVSNHARGPAARSRHNLIYWRGGDYVGVGPGAHGRLTFAGERWASVARRDIRGYLACVASKGTGSSREPLSQREIALERLLMGLRTREGVGLGDLAPLAIPDRTLALLARERLARVRSGRLTVSRRGRPVLDAITAQLANSA